MEHIIMSTEMTRMHVVWMLLVVLASGCVSSSIGSDVSAVKKLAHVPTLPKVSQQNVDAESAEDARELLKRPLDAEGAVRVALLNNRELRAVLRELGIARGRMMQAGVVANPLVEVELLPERDSDLELRVEYQITSLLMAPMHKRAEEHALEAARFEVAGEVVELGYEVRVAFYALQAAEQQLALAQQTLDALAAGRDAAVALLQAGNIPGLDASTQIAGYERARITVAKQELTVAELREAMQRLLGLYGQETQWTVASTLLNAPEETPDLKRVEASAIAANLGLRATKKRLDALAKRTGIARTEGYLPEVSVDVHSLHTDAEGPGAEKEWRWGGGVSVEVPLFDRKQGRRREVEAEFDALLERYQGLAIDLRSQAREVRNRLVSAHLRARQYERVIVPAQRAVMEQTLLQYNAMQLSVFQLLQARREQLDVELAYIDTLREYWSAEAELTALLSGRMVKTKRSDGVSREASSEPEGGH